ncbi:hypothetical protein JW935_15265 [candidate division KSB1 bacterium]|nr:hypothetical protein [candidate division KSB1 bacterium]
MKSYTKLFSKVIAFDNLLKGANGAAYGKRERDYALKFFRNLEENLFQLQSELQSFKYCPGAY